jgi:YD repeat-containing protein
MVNSNFLAPVMLTENFIDTIKTKSVKTDYISSLINSNYYIPTTKYYSFKNDSFKKEMSYSFFDDTNNIKEIERIDDTSSLSSVFYIWGYNNEYPIAKIDNFTSTEADAIQSLIDDAIDASNLDDDNQTSNPTGKEKALKDALNIIRNHSSLNKSQMSSYTYDPLVGITSMTDPRGYTVYYEYDEFNRLKQVKDAEGNILSKNEYNYKN